MSLFGEIVEPTSRTTFEDWDDDFAQNSQIKLNWSTVLEVPEVINTFFILEGRYLSSSVTQSPEIDLVNSIGDISLKLYKFKSRDGIYVCTIKEYDLLQSSEIVELLKPIINKSDNIISLLTKPLPEYQSNYPITKSCVVRKLNTTAKSSSYDFDFERLEQPNIISGVSAGVTCLREYQSLPATVLVYYVEHSNDQIEEINNQLENLKIIQNTKFMHSSILSSNLYI